MLAAYEGGCRRFDCALTGLGDCPFPGDDRVGNVPTELLHRTLEGRGVESGISAAALRAAIEAADEIRKDYAS